MPRSAWRTWFIRSPRSLGNRRPVPLAPRHRRVWRDLGRWCSCGLRWRGCPAGARPHAHDRVALSVYLCAVLYDAAADLYRLHPHDGPDPAALFTRFLGWVPHARRAASDD